MWLQGTLTKCWSPQHWEVGAWRRRLLSTSHQRFVGCFSLKLNKNILTIIPLEHGRLLSDCEGEKLHWSCQSKHKSGALPVQKCQTIITLSSQVIIITVDDPKAGSLNPASVIDSLESVESMAWPNPLPERWLCWKPFLIWNFVVTLISHHETLTHRPPS